MRICIMNRLLFICILGAGLLTLAGLHPAPVAAASLAQTSCTLPATVTTASQLSACITAANANGAGQDTITLGANITLSAALPQITTAIKLEGADHFIDGGDTMRIFSVASTGNFTVNRATLQNGNATNNATDDDDGGGISNAGTLIITESTLMGNRASDGGAIFNAAGSLSALANSTITDNRGRNGGGIYGAGTMFLFNSTVSGNHVDFGGAGVWQADDGVLTVTGTTFYGNLGLAANAIFADSGTTLHLAGNLFAGGGNCDIRGTFNDRGYNLSDDATCTNGGTGSATNATLNLGTLADNGGPTQTHLPGANSAATGAIPNGTAINNNSLGLACNNTTTDQTGLSRPPSTGADCTSGAVEVPCLAWTATTADELYRCILRANGNESPSPTANTITLGADITLTSALPQISSEITIEGAGYAIDGSNSVQIFNVGSAGDLTIKVATLQNGFAISGGAIDNAGTFTVINSTFSGNKAAAGAAVVNYYASMVTAINSTFSGNTATDLGGAIYNLGTLILTNNTFAGNAAPTGGSINNATAAAYLAGNIFARGSNGTNCFTSGAINDNGYNLSDDATCTNNGTGSATNATLSLGALADNGGPTQTRLPSAGSDAIGAIPNGTTISNNGTIWACKDSTPFVDQRGEARPQNSGDGCTAGAVEVATNSTTLTIIKDATPALGTDFDFTINSVVLNSYSGSTSSNPFWTRPNEGSTCTLSAVSTRYHVQAFMVDTSGSYNLGSSQQSGFNGYIHLYQDSFNPLAPCTNYLNGDDDTLSTRSSEIFNQSLESGRTYYFVTSGYSSSAAGNFTNSINGPGNAYTLYDAFTLDDAAPDDGDSVSNTITYNVEPGTYSITELLSNSIWNLSNATCTGASGTVSLTDETLSVAISDGEAVQCTFVNETLCPAAWTVTTADELTACITLANANESPSPTADTITLGADITLSTALPQISSAITLAGANHFIDGGHSVQLFYVTSGGDFTVNRATLQNGSATFGGGIFNTNGTLTVVNSTFSGNTADNGGGGIYNLSGTATVTNSTISGNTASFGGGIVTEDGIMTVAHSTISGNTADDGGGIYNLSGTLIVTNSTLSGNSNTGYGGGIRNYGTLTVTSSTFSGNTADDGGGIYNYGTVHLAGSIFVRGTSGNNCVDDNGTLNDNGYNLSDDATCTDGGTGSMINATLNLAALADNGGPTQTHLPGAGSAAIGVIPNGTTISNNGASWTCDQSATDQRGESRPINSGDDCTAGAVEVAPICTSWMVTTAAELSDCITLANANESPSPTADTITLGADITLSTALPQITSAITLEGANYFIDGGDSVRIFYVAATGNFTVNQVTLQNGSATRGGGLYNLGTLTVTNSTFSGNTADNGGAIINFGSLTVTSSTFSGSTATTEGGGIFNGDTLTVSNSTFFRNTAGTYGGGISNWHTATVSNSTFSSNSAANESGGGGIHNDGSTLTVTNSTFSTNSSNGSHGTSISNYVASDRVYLAGNIFMDNTPVDNCDTINGNESDVFIDNGYNLSDDASCVNGGTGSATNATLPLGALADNGGSTQTHLPSAGSDAIGAIPNGTTISNNGTSWTCNQSATDQRGVERPINGGDACTAGAVEVTSAAAVVGDVNCDGSVTITDALMILQYDVGLRTESGGCPLGDSATELDAANGDVNGDGLTTISDALLILQCDVGMTNDFCPVTTVVAHEARPNTDETAVADEAADGEDKDQAMSHQLFLPLVTR